MRLSNQQSNIIKAYANVAVQHFLKTYKLDCSISATRVACEVLSKFHFKVKPLTVEVQVYNEEYIKKGENPKSDEEFKEWLKEGAVAIKLEDYLVAIVNEKTLLDLSISQASRPENLVVAPVLCDAYDEFLTGQNPVFINNFTCVTIYYAKPENKKYLSNKDWFDKGHTAEIVREIYSDVKSALRR